MNYFDLTLLINERFIEKQGFSLPWREDFNFKDKVFTTIPVICRLKNVQNRWNFVWGSHFHLRS